MNRIAASAAALAALLALAPPAHAVLELEGIYWLMSPSGDGSVGIDGAEGTSIDVEDDLGYDSEEGAFGARLVLGNTHQLEVSYIGFDISAEAAIDRTVQFSDKTYRARANLASSLEASVIRGAYRFRGGTDVFGGGFLLGGQYVDLTASVSADRYGAASASTEVGLPVVGAFAEFSPAGFVRLYGTFVAGLAEWDDVSATFYEAEASVRVLLGPVFAGAGYRYLAIDGEDEGIPLEVDLAFQGPTAYAGVTF
jgi:hypothetical protein